MELIVLLGLPLFAGLACLVARTPAAWERLNLLAFGGLAGLTVANRHENADLKSNT